MKYVLLSLFLSACASSKQTKVCEFVQMAHDHIRIDCYNPEAAK